MTREPVVAGRFYQGTENKLRSEVSKYIDEKQKREKAVGIVSPHAGFMYSGPVAGAVFSSVVLPDTFVILGPNHTGYGKPEAIMTDGVWKTPLGKVEIDRELGKAVLSGSSFLKEDTDAFAYEHSIEVQLPFIQYLKKEFTFVPVCLATGRTDKLAEIGKAIADGIKKTGKNVLVVASSDMTHYEPHEDAKEKDKIALDAILKLDEKLLLRKVTEENISMCGYALTASMIVSAKELDAKSARVVRYMTSGETSGDYSSVVGYAGVLIS